MKIVNIKSTNFLSYEDFDLEIPNGVHLITGYNYDDETANGAGKSAIMDMMSYALFGVLPRAIKVDEVAHLGSNGSSSVEIKLTERGRDYRIFRSRKPNELRMYVDKTELNAKDAREMQGVIERTLGINFQIFINSVYFYQNAKSHFVSASDAEKREILTNLLNLAIFDDAYKLVSDKSKALDTDVVGREATLGSIQAQINTNNRDIERYQQESKGFEQHKKDRVASCESRRVAIEANMGEIEAQVGQMSEAVGQLGHYKKALGGLDKKLATIEIVKSEIAKLRQQRSQKGGQLQGMSGQIAGMHDLVSQGKCPTCRRGLDHGTFHDEVEFIERQASTINLEIQNIDKEIEEFGDLLKLGDCLPKERSDAIAEISRLEQLSRQVADSQDILFSKKAEIEQLSGQIQGIKDEVNGYKKLIEDKIKVNTELTENYRDTHDSLVGDRELLERYGFLREVYRNVKYYVFDNVVVELNSRVNDYVKALFDTDVSIRFDTETETSKGDVKQKFSAVLTKDGRERNFNSLSGGEKKRIEIATNFALSDIIANRSGKSFEFMMLDECFEGLDTAGRNRVVELLECLRDKRANIFVIDHFDSMKTLVDSEIRIEKREGVSKVAA